MCLYLRQINFSFTRALRQVLFPSPTFYVITYLRLLTLVHEHRPTTSTFHSMLYYLQNNCITIQEVGQ